jgi:hypothetical protein
MQRSPTVDLCAYLHLFWSFQMAPALQRDMTPGMQ